MEDRWLSVEEISNYLGVSKDTVYSWLSDEKIPAHRVGKLWKFKTTEVDEWVTHGGASAGKKNADKKNSIRKKK